MALGAGARATGANQVVLGSNAAVLVAPGLSTSSTAAQSGSTYLVTTNSKGVLGSSTITTTSLNSLMSSTSGLQASVASLQGSVATLQNQMNRAFSGVAISMASIPGYLPENKNFGVSAHYGGFNGQSALGASFMARISDNIVVDADRRRLGHGGRRRHPRWRHRGLVRSICANS